MRAATHAKALLRDASRQLQTANPADELGDVIEEALPLPVGDRRYDGARLLEPTFSEIASNALSFLMSTGGPEASPGDRVETAASAMRGLVSRHLGRPAMHWLDGRMEAAMGRANRPRDFGAWFGSGFDQSGLTESYVCFEWGPSLTDSLPAPLYHAARIAVQSVPGLRPSFSTVRCGRSAGSQQITFEADRPLPLRDLKPLLDQLGLGQQHAGLMSAVAFILGARFTLPPGSCTITLRPSRAGMELRLDVALEAIPDPPPQLMSLLRLALSERPRSLRAVDRWVLAMTPLGHNGPGDLSVLSVTVRPDMPARIALFLRPAALVEADADASGDEGSEWSASTSSARRRMEYSS